jgi:hypothetical protein
MNNSENIQKLIGDQTIGNSDTVYLYDDYVCCLSCRRFPARIQDYFLESLESSSEYCGDAEPDLEIPVSKIDFSKLSVLVPTPFLTGE